MNRSILLRGCIGVVALVAVWAVLSASTIAPAPPGIPESQAGTATTFPRPRAQVEGTEAGTAATLPRLRAQVDRTEISVGDRVILTIAIDHPPEATVHWPQELELDPFELIEMHAAEPVVTDGVATSTATLAVTAFELGELELPSFTVILEGADGTAIELSTDVFRLVVGSVGLDEGEDIRDLKGPLGIDRNWLLFVPWLLAALALAAGAYWLFRKLRARHESALAPEPGPPPRPAHEVAYEALAALETSALLDRGQVKEYYIEVSDIIRAYIEDRFAVTALEMTSSEVLSALAGAGLDDEVRAAFGDFLNRSDLVKFAKHVPDAAACRAMIPAARQLVDSTRVVPPPEPETVAGGEGPAGTVAEALGA